MSIKLALHMNDQHPTLRFAAEEVRHFLGSGTIVPVHESNWQLHVRVDAALPAYAFAIDAHENGTIVLSGHDESCALHAVYTWLEKLGWRFEITGARRLQASNLEAQFQTLVGWSAQFQPAVNQRGIRQHLNFPMDISGYTLHDAEEYLRNLARLRLNHITFHSYSGQWYEVHYPGATQLAGEYFYGQRHDLPDDPLLRRAIHNQTTFCIPENEALINDPVANSRAAISWLQALMNEAKRVGLTIQFSFELRDSDLELSLVTVTSILHTYPLIDVLEIITEETGVWASSPPVDELKALVGEYFGAAALIDPAIAPHLIDGQKDLDKLVRQIGHGIEVIKHLRQQPRIPALALGVYCTVPADQKIIIALLERYVPENVEYTLLFDHGNRAVADNLRALDMPREDWQRTLIYSWIEFDGTVYLFQNALTGVEQLMRLATSVMGDQPVHGIALNHWRTAENRTTARYAALTMLNGVLPRSDFYTDYAQSLGIERNGVYTTAMNLLDDADTQARYDLPNVGFSFVGCWGQEGLGYYGVFQHEKVIAVQAKYAEALDLLRVCAQTTTNPDGQAYLAFLENRVSATATYLQAIDFATLLQPLCDGRTPDQLTLAEQAAVRAICDQALGLMQQYMDIHAAALPDRGCEGTLISFYYTPPAVLKRIRAEYGSGQSLSSVTAQTFDAPPSPIAQEESH